MSLHDELFSRLSVIEMELNTMASAPANIIEELMVAKEQGKNVTDLVVLKKMLHCFMINHGFVTDTPLTFFNEQANIGRYRFRCRPEYQYTLKLCKDPEDNDIDIIMKRTSGSVQRSAIVSVGKIAIPNVSRESLSNDEFLIEKLLIACVFKFSKLWTSFSSSSVGSDGLPSSP